MKRPNTDTDFVNRIRDGVKKLFPAGAVETLVARPAGPWTPEAPHDPAIRLVHTPTGLTVTCDEFPSQTENFIAAAIRLRIACDEQEFRGALR